MFEYEIINHYSFKVKRNGIYLGDIYRMGGRWFAYNDEGRSHMTRQQAAESLLQTRLPMEEMQMARTAKNREIML